MTFQDKRNEKIAFLKKTLEAYIDILSDPELANPSFARLVECEKMIVMTREDIINLNKAEQS